MARTRKIITGFQEELTRDTKLFDTTTLHPADLLDGRRTKSEHNQDPDSLTASGRTAVIIQLQCVGPTNKNHQFHFPSPPPAKRRCVMRSDGPNLTRLDPVSRSELDLHPPHVARSSPEQRYAQIPGPFWSRSTPSPHQHWAARVATKRSKKGGGGSQKRQYERRGLRD